MTPKARRNFILMMVSILISMGTVAQAATSTVKIIQGIYIESENPIYEGEQNNFNFWFEIKNTDVNDIQYDGLCVAVHDENGNFLRDMYCIGSFWLYSGDTRIIRQDPATVTEPAGNYQLVAKIQYQGNWYDISPYSSNQHNPVWFEVVKRLSPPRGVRASDGAYTNRITILWDPVSGASYYRVYRNTINNSGGAEALGNWQVAATYNDYDYNTTPCKDYYYWVKSAISSSGDNASDFSSPDVGWRALPKPINIQASDGAYTDHINISWDSVTGANYYRVYRNTTNNTTTAQALGVWQSSLNFDDYDVTPNQNFYYWVKASTTNSDYRTSDFSSSDIGFAGEQNPLPTVTLLSPNSGTFKIGDTMNIQWNSNSQHHYGLYLLKGGSEVGVIIFDNPSTAQNYDWEIPSTVNDSHGNPFTIVEGNDYQIGITVWDDIGDSANDESDNNISIEEPGIPTRFNRDQFIDKTAKVGIPVLLKGKLEENQSPYNAISGETVHFDIYYSGSWHEIQEDVMEDTSFITDSNGIASVYYTPQKSLPTGEYQIRARYDGSDTYSSCELTRNLTINKPSWILMYYLCNGDDTGMDGGLEVKFDTIAGNLPNDDIEVFVLSDRITEPDYVFRMKEETDVNNYTDGFDRWTPESIGISGNEFNTGDVATINTFTNFVISNYDADHFSLIIFNHGSGIAPTGLTISPNNAAISGIGWDSDGGYLSISELGQGIQNVKSNLGRNLELLHLDACLMQMIEINHEVKDRVDYLIACENEGWYFLYGPSWENYLGNINANTSVLELATNIANSYFNYPLLLSAGRTISVTNVRNVGNVTEAVDDLANTLISNLPSMQDQIELVRNNAQKFAYPDINHTMLNSNWFIDLRDFCEELKDVVTNNENIVNAADNVIEAIGDVGGDFIMLENHQNSPGATINSDYWFDSGTYGVSVFFPESEVSPYFNYINNSSTPANLSFTTNTRWDDFLRAYFGENIPTITSYTPQSGAVGTEVTIYGSNFGSTEGTVTFNGINASITSWTGTEIHTTAPSGVTTGFIIVTNADGKSSNGVSFSVNYINPTVTVTSPNGGEIWEAGTTQTISWTTSGDIVWVEISVRRPGDISVYLENINSNPGSTTWNIPIDRSGTFFVHIRVGDSTGQEAEDVSDGYFDIIDPSSVDPPFVPPQVIFTSTSQVIGEVDLTVDSTDNLHAAWSDNFNLYYRKKVSSSWEPMVQIINDGSVKTNGEDHILIEVDTNNRPHIIYKSINDDLFYTYYTGAFFTSPINLTNLGNIAFYRTAIDSSDNIHLIFRDFSYQGKYRKIVNGSIDPSASATLWSSLADTVGIAVAPNGEIYAFRGCDGLFYKKFSSGSWGSEETLTTTSGDGYPLAEVDSTGVAHIVWRNTSNISGEKRGLWYATLNNEGAFSTPALISTCLGLPRITLDNDNFPIVSNIKLIGTNSYISIIKKTDCGWVTKVASTNSQGADDPAPVKVDSNNIVHVIYKGYESGNQVVFHTYGDANGFTPPPVTISGFVTCGGSGLESVVMNGLPGNPTTDSEGFYTASVNCNWSGDVTPALSGYSFNPVSTTYTNVTYNQTTNYTATYIIDTITITSPNGGESLAAGSVHEVTWTFSGNINNVLIEYSIDGGTSWANIVQSTINGGSFSWIVPDTPSSNCLVRISGGDSDESPSDISDAVFSIVSSSSPAITVFSPNGGENLVVGSMYEITWTSNGIEGDVKIEYSINRGFTWSNVVSFTNNDGTYSWLVSDTPSEQCVVRISGVGGDENSSDRSDGVFSIVPSSSPTITVISPNGGEKYTAGLPIDISWCSSGIVSDVKIEYSTNMGTSWTTVTPSTSNNGSYTWITVPSTQSDDCLIRISDIDGDPLDNSDSVFSIVLPSSITVISPNGGENWEVGSQHNITWSTTGTVGDVKIEYSIDIGDTWENIVTCTDNDGIYNWVLPDDPSEHCLIRISTCDSDAGSVDISDAVFSMTSGESLTLKAPNGDEKLQAGENFLIEWEIDNEIPDVKLEYSPDNGSTYITLEDRSPNTGYYNWQVPYHISANCLIRISNADGMRLSQPSLLYELKFKVPSFIFLTSKDEVFKMWLGDALNEANRYITNKISITQESNSNYYVQFNETIKEIQTLTDRWHMLKILVNLETQLATLWLNDKTIVDDLPLHPGFIFSPAVSFATGPDALVGVEIDDITIKVLDSQKGCNRYITLFSEDFENSIEGEFPLNSGWRRTVVRVQKQIKKKYFDEILINPDSRFGSKSQEWQDIEEIPIIIAVKHFSIPERVPFDISNRTFEIIDNGNEDISIATKIRK